MKNLINNCDVFIPLLETPKTIMPTLITDENGNHKYVHVEVDPSTINNVSADDYSLGALIRSGINPELSHISTSSVNSSSEISSNLDIINSLPTE